MRSDSVAIRLRDPFLLDVSTYISVGVMALLGISGLSTLQLQIMALALCLAYILLYRFVFRTNYYERRPELYFGSQAIVMALLFLTKSGTSDAFNFLFYMLTVHAAVVLTLRAAAFWTAVYFAIACVVVFAANGVNGWYAALFYLAVFIVCIFLGHVIQQTDLARERNQKLVDELQATQNRLQELAVVEERNRLARELHDSVKQQVFAISMQLGAARTALSETDTAYQSVMEAERLAQQAGAELTTLISALRPPGLESKTLANAVRQHVEEWSKQNAIQADIKVDDVYVNLNVEQALFRILQEALANVARHSEADKVTVEFKAENGAVMLTIEDNGVGFDSDRITKGVGLDSMRERLASVNGGLQITRLQVQGTRLVAKVNLNNG